MRRIVIAGFTAALAAGCCPCRHMAAGQRDSVRVVSSVHTVDRIVYDTVWAMLPDRRDRVVVRDTVSRLENDFAASLARVSSDGTLCHELITRPGSFPVTVGRRETVTVRTDTVCIDRVRRDIVEVARPLTWWQQTQIGGFRLLAAAGALWLLVRRVWRG